MTALLGNPPNYEYLPDLLCYVFLNSQKYGVEALKEASVLLDKDSDPIPQPYSSFDGEQKDFSKEYVKLKKFCKKVTVFALECLKRQEPVTQGISKRDTSEYQNPFKQHSKSDTKTPQERFKDILDIYCKKIDGVYQAKNHPIGYR